MTFRAKLPVRLFTAVSGMGFVALLDAYITRLDTNCSDISAPVDPLPARISGESTWNQHRLRTARFTMRDIGTSKRCRVSPKKFRATAWKQAPPIGRQMMRDQLSKRLPLHRKNGCWAIFASCQIRGLRRGNRQREKALWNDRLCFA
jgi:hypothetical protein